MKTGQPDVVVSTGIGRLHLIETARAIHAGGRTVGLITGWTPTPSQRIWVNALGRVLGQKRLYERLADRQTLLALEGCTVSQCPWSETAMTLLAKLSSRDHDWLATRIWAWFGRESRSHLRGTGVFHVRSGAGGGGAIEAARRRGMKIVADHSIGHPTVIWKNLRENGAAGREAESFGPSSVFWGQVMSDCAKADAVLVNSDYVRQTLLEQGFDGRKIHVAYLGVDRDWLGVKREHRILAHDPIRALFTGHFVKRKGSHLVVEAARRLRDNGVAVEFHVAGRAHDGPAEVEAGGVAKMFRFHGLISPVELRTKVAESDLFVFPTLAEGCAKAAMEALGAGLPVITTRECGLPEAADHCVRLVPLGRADVLAAAIEELGADRERRASYGTAGVELVRRSFGPDNFTKAVGALYDELLRADWRAAPAGIAQLKMA
jgi:glycosyltransferase involved in cell wall biosynthesis